MSVRGAVNGARVAYEMHSTDNTENSTSSKASASQTSKYGPNSAASRAPLTAVQPRKTASDMVDSLHPVHIRGEQSGGRGGTMPNSVSEPDSLLDLYGRESNHEINGVDPDIPENMYRPEDVDDPDGWIHRDKLAKIESEELQAAGINLATARKKMSKTSSLRANRVVAEPVTNVDASPTTTRDIKRQRVSSPMPEADEAAEHASWDLRSPAEIAADTTLATQAPSLRKERSRIPVLTSSPLPIPQERVERDTPIPRKRTMSGSMLADDATMGRPVRSRQNSTGSQMLLDEGEGLNATPTQGERTVNKTGSPKKAKIPHTSTGETSPPGTANAARKTTPAPRKITPMGKSGIPTSTTSTTTSPSQRPGTRSGEQDRPRTAVNRPEGDPPWLATMYKPDPRLPPEEQIIPTHARRQQQDQWMQEGAIPSTYDRDFSPLAVHTGDGVVKQSSPAAMSSETADQENAWPLKPIPGGQNVKHERPGTSGSTTAGYSTMPKVTSPPLGAHSPKLSSAPSPKLGGPAPVRLQQRQLPDDEENKGKKSDGCGCCIIM